MNMRKTVLGLALVASLACVSQAQTTTTNTADKVNILAEAVDQVTNVAFLAFGSYNVDTKTMGGGVGAVYNVTKNIGTGAFIEGMGSDVQVINANLEFRLPIHPLKSLGYEGFEMTPWAGVFLGTPFSGAGDKNGGLSTGAGGGLYANLLDVGKGWKLSAGGGAVKWSGGGAKWDGLHIMGFLSLNHGI